MADALSHFNWQLFRNLCPSLSTGAMGFTDPQLLPLVGALVVPATWTGHGKSWDEWCCLLGEIFLPRDRESLLNITLSYLVHYRGFSAAVAQRKLTGVRFHLLLRGREDVTRDLII